MDLFLFAQDYDLFLEKMLEKLSSFPHRGAVYENEIDKCTWRKGIKTVLVKYFVLVLRLQGNSLDSKWKYF